MKKPLWEPSAELKKQANMTRFMELVNQKYGKTFRSYPELYDWSISQIPDFWDAMWEFGGIKASKKYDRVVDDLYQDARGPMVRGRPIEFRRKSVALPR